MDGLREKELMKPKRVACLLAIFPFMVACSGIFASPGTDTPAATTTRPAATTPSTVSATAEPTQPPATLAPSETPGQITAAPLPASETPEPTFPPATEPAQVPEGILILTPGPGSRLISPIRVSGMADSTFEQALAVRLVLDDGSELNVVPAQIAAELGERGPFEAEVPFTIGEERQAFIQVFVTSARDGGITHLAAVGVSIAPSGLENIVAVEPHPERIVILEPALGATVSGGLVHVRGFGWASFEQNLVIEVYEEMGNLTGRQAVTVQSPEMGQPGPFSADVPYNIQTAGAGRVVVRDPSPAFDGDVHLSSVEVRPEP